MNTSFFIAKRLIQSESTEKGLSKPIVRIATIGIALGMAVMIVALAIVSGFQNEIREKVIGFGSHIQITNFGNAQRYNDPKLEINQDFYPHIDTVDGVKSIHIYALKQGIIETPENIQGIFAKGVDAKYDWSFLESKIVDGRLLSLSDTVVSNEILISKYLSGRLQLGFGDRVTIYFSNAANNMSQRNFTIVGIYDTGLRELDAQFVFIDIGQLRKINQWGIDAQLIVQGCENDSVFLSAIGFGGDGEHRFLWSADSLRGPGPHGFCIRGDTVVSVVVTDRGRTIGDTAFFTIANWEDQKACTCPGEQDYRISTSGGSGKYYTGGFDIQLDEYSDLDRMDQFIYEHLNYDLRTTTIKQRSPEIFNWLEMLDLNTLVIIGLMILISVINMTSALLILIMERTNMIGILKSMGARSWLVQKIFLVQAAYIIGIGMVIGNVVGLGLCFLQAQYGWLKLDPENYYVSEVPILLSINQVLFLNIGTLAICLIMLLLPSFAVNQIRPAKAIRFD